MLFRIFSLISQKNSYLVDALPKLKRMTKINLSPSLYKNRAPFYNDKILEQVAKGLSSAQFLESFGIILFPM